METFANNAVGNLNASILIGATSLVLQAGQGALFPATGNFRIVIGTEIIIVGARSGDTLSSLTRGAESTAAAAHNSADVVTHEVTAGALNPLGTGAGAWTSYTPTLSGTVSNPTLGTGNSIVARYVQIGKLVIVNGYIGVGAAGFVNGSGGVLIPFPVAARTTESQTGSVAVGSGTFSDSSALAVYMLQAELHDGSSAEFRFNNVGTGFVMTYAAPVTVAQSDEFRFAFFYEAA